MKTLLAKLLTLIPSSIAQFVTLSDDTRIGRWYHTNGIFRFPVDTAIALRTPRSFGYGIRPVGVVTGYTKEGKYIIQMEIDDNGNFFDWLNGCYVPKGKRKAKEEVHFKWNIEYHFKKIPEPDVHVAYG